MKDVLKPIEVVFLQPETACSGMQSEGTVLLGQHWMIDQHGKSNTATLCSRCRLGTDPDAFNPSGCPSTICREGTLAEATAVPEKPGSRGA